MKINYLEVLGDALKLATEIPAEVAVDEAQLDAGQSVSIDDVFRVTVGSRKLSVGLTLKEVK